MGEDDLDDAALMQMAEVNKITNAVDVVRRLFMYIKALVFASAFHQISSKLDIFNSL
jgi:hypothetical protein